MISRRAFLATIAGAAALHTRTGWAAQGSGKGSLRLAFYTDIHARTEWDTPLALARAARAINAAKPDIAIAGGDLITDGLQSSAATAAPRWNAYMAMHTAIDADIHTAIGNHDLVAAIPEDGTPPAANPRKVYLDRLGLARTYYSFDAVGYHFIVLDPIQVTGDELKYQGMVGPEQLEWLKRNLSRIAADTPIVLLCHIPLLTAFYGATEGTTFTARRNRVVVNNTEVLGLFGDHNLILVLQGHLHAQEVVRWRRTTFITGGAVSAKWWRGPWYGTEEGFNVITLRGDHVDWKYIDYGWEARRP